MASCRKVTRLLSESLERDLSVWERIDLYVHLGICTACRAYRRQIEMIRRLVQEAGDQLDDAVTRSGEALTPEARQRIHLALQSRQRGGGSGFS